MKILHYNEWDHYKKGMVRVEITIECKPDETTIIKKWLRSYTKD